MSNLVGVREYDRIRRYLEGIYLYGFLSRDDFARAGIGSVKDYDQGTKLIRDLFPETEEAALWKDGRKYLRIQRAYARSGENRMSDSYLLSAMDAEEELPVLLGVLFSLAGGEKTVGRVCQETAIHIQVEDSLDYNKIRRWLLVQPMALRVDERLGRWYLLAMGERPQLMRVSVIRSVKQKERLSPEKWEAGARACRAAFAKSGCSGHLPDGGPATVRARLRFETAPGMEAQFLRELRVGEVLRQKDGAEYRGELNDPGELTAFLRSYSPWLALEPGAHGLRERIRADLLELRAQLKGDKGV